MSTQYRINTEKTIFLKREKNNMDTEKEDILTIYINLINMVNVFYLLYTKLLKVKKDIRNISLLQTNDK